METIKLYAFAGVLVTDSERDEYPTESGATLILSKADAATTAKTPPAGYRLSAEARRLCRDFAKAPQPPHLKDTPMLYRWTLLATDDRTPHLKTGGYPIQNGPQPYKTQEEAEREGEHARARHPKKARLYVRVDRTA